MKSLVEMLLMAFFFIFWLVPLVIVFIVWWMVGEIFIKIGLKKKPPYDPMSEWHWWMRGLPLPPF